MQQIRPPALRAAAKSQLRGDILRATMAGLVLVGIFVTAIGIGSGWHLRSLSKVVYAKAVPPSDDDDLTTGSIVFVPDFGDKCRQNEIDNATWQVREIGIMPCREALAPKSQSRAGFGPRTRIDIIRESFRNSGQ